MKIASKRLALAIASASLLALYGCGGGGGGGTSPVAADTTSMTVTPSLGRFSIGTVVKLFKLDGSLISTGTVAANGSAVLALAGYTGPVVVTVEGGPLVTYYDEATGSFPTFGAGNKLSAIMAAPQATVGVTPMTHAAFSMLGVVGSSTTTANINNVNTQLAAAFGLSNILEAPNPVNTAANALDIAAPADKYALVLAALAKTANPGKNAADVAVALALDLKDGKLDGLDGTSATPLVPLAAFVPANLASQYQTVAITFATPSSQTVIAVQPLVITTTLLTGITAQSNQSAITQAKALFAELRTTLNSFVNNNKTGFLDIQAKSMSDDLNANVASDMGRLSKRIQQIGMATSAYEDAVAYTSSAPNGFVSGFAPGTTSPAVLVRTNGTLSDVWFGRNNFESCAADSITPSLITKVQCFEAAADSADFISSRIKAMVYVITKTAANQYSYTATRWNKAVTATAGSLTFAPTSTIVVTDAVGNNVPAGSGTISTVFSGSTRTAFTVTGTLPPSATGTSPTGTPNAVVTTGADTVAITATRTALTGNNYRYALTGSTAASKLVGGVVDTTKTVTVSFDSGSYFDVDETNVNAYAMVGTKVIGTIKTLATQFTGTLDLTAWSNDADGKGAAPTNINFNGKLSDLTTGGAGQILTGNLQMIVNNYGQYHSTAAVSSTNFTKGSLTFTGTIQMPQRPLMSMTFAVLKSVDLGATTTLNYSYGSTSITGSGSSEGVNVNNPTMTLSNQDGIMLVTNTNGGTVTKSGSSLATITNGRITYADGFSESLN